MKEWAFAGLTFGLTGALWSRIRGRAPRGHDGHGTRS